MAKDKVTLNHKFVTAPQYAKATGLSYEQVLHMCRSNELVAVQSEGGHWSIKVDFGDYATKEDFQRLLEENARLKAIVESVSKLTSTAHVNKKDYPNPPVRVIH